MTRGHAQIPVVQVIGGLWRVYVTDRTPANKSYIRYFDFCPLTGSVMPDENNMFFAGQPNQFDSDGVMTACIVDDRFYYTGWKIVGNKYHHNIGMALMRGGHLTNRIVVMAADEKNEFLCSSPFITVKKQHWRMWFISGEGCGGWTDYGPKYTIKHAESSDGLNWKETGMNFPRRENEVFARPFVIHDTIWKMWYSYLFLEKNKCYRIGYAESQDGVNWVRKDNLVGIDVSSEGWDSETVAFPYIMENHMFYSGNKFGEGGVGYAVKA